MERSARQVRVVIGNETLADSRAAYRVLETSHPPTWYIPPDDVRLDLLQPTRGRSVCEFKGVATYFDLVMPERRIANVAWTYREPRPGYEMLRDHLCFYASRVDACFVDGERVQAQRGDFYGGWITSDVEGPFKGGPGTWGW